MRWITTLVLVFVLTGCGADEQGVAGTTGSPTSTVLQFDREMSKKGCEILTAELVGATFDVPANALQQMKIMGCRYSWDNDEETLEAGISMLRVYDNEAAAASWFANATRSKTAEEMKADMEKISEQMDKSEQLDTELKKSTAKNMMSMIGTNAINFEDVANIGDEARMNDDGTVYVRVGNLTFMVSAYKGPKAPPPEIQGADLQQMMEIAKEHSAKWAIETAPQRRADGVLLARAIAGQFQSLN